MKKLVLLSALLMVSLSGMAQLRNGNFSQWQDQEPKDWTTNNLYDADKKFILALVIPAGESGAKLTVKKVLTSPPEPVAPSFYGGSIASSLMPTMLEGGKSVQLSFSYQFKSDSADVLKAQITLESRNNQDGTLKPNPQCTCQLQTESGDIMTLPTAESSKTVALKVTFPKSTDPTKVPVGCMMYVWKIKFWLENPATHLHENTYAIIEKIQL